MALCRTAVLRLSDFPQSGATQNSGSGPESSKKFKSLMVGPKMFREFQKNEFCAQAPSGKSEKFVFLVQMLGKSTKFDFCGPTSYGVPIFVNSFP